MAKYNEILVGRFNRGLQKLFGLKGPTPIGQAGGEILPVLETENMMSLELRLLQSWRSWANTLAPGAGGAGNRTAVRLRNPTGSNVIAVVEKITFVGSGAAVDFPFITRGPTGTGDLTSSVTAGNVRDVRIGPLGPTILQSFSTAATVVGINWWQGALAVNAQSDAILYSNQELVIGPGDVMTIFANTLNQGMLVSYFWRERALEEGELSGLL